ncbi:MAG: hypothetical protein VXW87_04320 [Pseudomonadota bacterium]|nr:hypothetical protein [Pseudomonadota bacterium]
MFRQEAQNTLNLFKRVHKKQIATKEPLLTPEIEERIKRKNLKSMTDADLKKLLKTLIKKIDVYQKNRIRPHAGLLKFKDSLASLLVN